MKHFLYSAAAVALLPLAGHSATIVYGASNTDHNYLVNSDGTSYVPNGSLVRLGWFDANYNIDISLASDAMSASGRQNFESHFHELSFTRTPFTNIFGSQPGSFSASVDTPDTVLAQSAGKQMVMLAYTSLDNSSYQLSLSTVQQFGAFYLDKNADGTWAVPTDAQLPGQTTIDLGQLNGDGTGKTANLLAGAHIVVGRYTGINELNSAGARSFALAVVPEPGTAALALFGGGALLLRRRRRF